MSDLKLPEKFEGPRLKLKRAKRHLDEIDRLVSLYRACDPYAMDYQLTPDGTFYEGRLVAKFPPFLDFGVEIGELVYQLRSALDHVIYEFSVPNFPDAVPDRRRAERIPQFPIRLTTDLPDARTKEFNDRRLRYVAPPVRRLVETYQPLEDGHDLHPHPLAVLEALNVRDKHRVIHPATTDLHVRTVDLLPPGVTWQTTSQVNHRDVVVHVPAHLDPLRDLHPVVAYSLAIHIPEVAAVDLSFLRRIYEFVAEEVIPAFQDLLV